MLGVMKVLELMHLFVHLPIFCNPVLKSIYKVLLAKHVKGAKCEKCRKGAKCIKRAFAKLKTCNYTTATHNKTLTQSLT